MALLADGGRSRAANPDTSRIAADEALYARTATEVLNRDFSASSLSYLLLNVRSGGIIASRWPHSDEPLPAGSLVKPFTAMAYAEAHQFRFPEHTCMGAGMCWLPHGHGKIGLMRAVAQSCNAYFTALGAAVNPAQVRDVARRFGLDGPPVDATSGELAGRDRAWRESPAAIARAYAELLSRQSQMGIREIVAGMALAARDGTAAGISRAAPYIPVLAKTGTAPCTHAARASGDGFVLLAWPADAPHYLLLVRQHGHPGAEAAVTGGQMLRALEPQK